MLELLVHQLLDTGLESGQLLRIPPDPATLFPGGEPCRDAGSELGGRCPIRVTRLGDVEAPRLPPLNGFVTSLASGNALGQLHLCIMFKFSKLELRNFGSLKT